MTQQLALPLAVLDSSVLVPRWARVSLQCLAARQDPLYAPVWSEWIIAETWRVLTQQWLTRAPNPDQFDEATLRRAANGMLHYLLPVMRLVSLRAYTGSGPWPDLTDEDDAPIWQTAVVAGAQYVVSNNIGDFPPLVQGRHVYAGIEYLTAIEFIEDILGEDAEQIYGAPLPAGAAVRSRRGR
ncbi:MAG: PIN domain-containing protein [Chloroflexi bacterium]|nr:PIN domain-containing protein [Chloroflexota bacterium]